MKKHLFCFALKRNKAKKHFFCFALKRDEKIGSETKRSEAKRKIFGSETKRKYALLISLRSEAKNLKRKEAKISEKKIFIFHVSVRNGSRFAWFRFEAKTFFLRNRRTLRCPEDLETLRAMPNES